MCIAYLSIGHPQWPLLIAANRDEFHARASAQAGPWPGRPDVIAGRDLVAGGTWLGWTRQGRFGFLTNYREPGHPPPDHAPSRGALVRDFLLGGETAQAYADTLMRHAGDWAGFNLVVGDRDGTWYLSNRDPDGSVHRLTAGSHVLSNHLLDTPWPKTERLRENLGGLPAAQWALEPDAVFALLRDTTPAGQDELPATGLSPELEHLLSSPFIVSPEYGTRCSTVIAVSHDGHALFCEQTYGSDGRPRERHDWRLAPADRVALAGQPPSAD
ncbi:putative protein with NRDE domain OS=Castellaniella defragrans OX=75697 GN=HNR28_002854 PE=4 SV=1 [Castellaniella defragrans]